MRLPSPLLAFLATCLACSGKSGAPPAPSGPAPGVYSESFDYAAVEQARLRSAAGHGLELYQVMQQADFRSPALASLLAAASARGAGARAWIVLPKDAGYWPGETNLDAFGAAVDDFLAWVSAAKLPVGWITFDLEPDWAYTQAMAKIMADTTNPHRIDDLIALVKTHVDAAGFAAAQAKLAAIVGRVHAAGLRAHAVTYPMVLDGMKKGNTFLEDGFDIPVSGIPWDEVSFMVYRSTWQAFSATQLSSDLFYSYGVDARAFFGDAAGVDFGVVGADPTTGAAGYTDPSVLASDVAAARAAGVTRLHLYSLEEALAEPDPSPWLAFATAPAAPAPDDDASVRTFRTLFATLDAILGGS
jgi:hypothetical protein